MIFKNLLKKIATVALAGLIILMSLGVPVRTQADVVTDTLTVRVGYYGMDLSQYVVAGSYHWSELYQNLPLYEQAYSYFQGDRYIFDTDDYNPTYGTYNAIVDSARGFLITDILDYSNIYVGDVQNIMFYVEDSQGIRSAFDYDTLFETRYYFSDMAGHREVVYGTKQVPKEKESESESESEPEFENSSEDKPESENESEPESEAGIEGNSAQQLEAGEQETEMITVPDYTKVIGYRFNECWNYATTVEPMLAIEDNWASFNEEFEHSKPDFTSANAGSRFRLLFGQAYPTESLTGKSDKYVSSIYITLYGEPKTGEMSDGTGQYGANTVEFTVTESYNQDMTNELSKYLNVDSTDEEVIKIDYIETIESELYSDVAKVIVHYSVVGDGTASFNVGFGNKGEQKNYSGYADIVVRDGKATFSKNGEVETEEASKKEEQESKKTDAKEGETEGSGGDAKTEASAKENGESELEGGFNLDYAEIDSQIIESLMTTGMYTLSENLQELLKKGAAQEIEITPGNVTKEIQEVRPEDNTEEKDEEQRRIMLFVGLGVLVLMALGAGIQLLLFKIKREGRFWIRS